MFLISDLCLLHQRETRHSIALKMQSNTSPVEEKDCESRWTTKLPPTIKFIPMKERSLYMKETTSSSTFLSKGAVKTVPPPLLDNMTELEICCGPTVSTSSSSVQANVYVDHSLSQSPSQNINNQDPVLVIPLMPPQLSSKTLATVEQPGFIRLRMLHDLVVDISNDMTVRLYNPKHMIEVSVSDSGERAAVIHPSGRALFKPESLEAQCEDKVSLKKAKIDDRGISFTGSNLSEVYVLTVRGLRIFQEEFPQNLYLTDYVKSQFSRATTVSWLYSPEEYASISRKMLTKFIFETTGSEEVRLVVPISLAE